MVDQVFNGGSSEPKKKTNPKNIAMMLGGVIAVLVIAIVGVVIYNNNFRLNYEPDGTIDTSKSGLSVVSESTQAAILTQNIREQMKNDPNYELRDAEAKYKKVMEESTGKLKDYVGFQYAMFVYDETKDVNRAVKILEGMKKNLSENMNYQYYITMIYIYNRAGDEEKVREYQGLMSGGETGPVNVTNEEEK